MSISARATAPATAASLLSLQATALEYVASAFNGWQAVKIGSQVGWVSGEYSEITTE
jgi:hypothetical protein